MQWRQLTAKRLCSVDLQTETVQYGAEVGWLSDDDSSEKQIRGQSICRDIRSNCDGKLR